MFIQKQSTFGLMDIGFRLKKSLIEAHPVPARLDGLLYISLRQGHPARQL
jgi:hypothetical protein